MRPNLLYENHDFTPQWGMLHISPSANRWREREYTQQWSMLPHIKRMVIHDLELEILFQSMAGEDRFIYEVVKNVLLTGSEDTRTILYRQDILNDCIRNPALIRDIYRIADESIERFLKDTSWYSHDSANSVRVTSIRTLTLFVHVFELLRNLADNHGDTFESEGFLKFFAMIQKELPDEYLMSLKEKIGELSLSTGVYITVELGEGNKGANYALQKHQEIKKERWINKIFSREPPSQYSFTIADRDLTGFMILEQIKGRSMNTISDILFRSSNHILKFLTSLKIELAFYIGGLNLRESLTQTGKPICFPVPLEPGMRTFSCTGLYDVCMALQEPHGVIGNDINADNKDLIIVTGANRGGKSTFLRSAGLAQLMMQAGLFVPAHTYSTDVCRGVFTHFKREEDHAMKSGKLDEELKRMSGIVDHLKPDSMVLFNESFAATNEREGSEISRQIVSALMEKRVKMIFVTHLFKFSRDLYEQNTGNIEFLRAERKPDGERTFKVKKGEPLQTSYAPDLYNQIFLGIPLPAISVTAHVPPDPSGRN